jgi:hypothetical protein
MRAGSSGADGETAAVHSDTAHSRPIRHARTQGHAAVADGLCASSPTARRCRQACHKFSPRIDNSMYKQHAMHDPTGGFDHLLSQTAVVVIRTEAIITKEARTIWPGKDEAEADWIKQSAAL